MAKLRPITALLAMFVFAVFLFTGCDTNSVNETGNGNGNNPQPVIHTVTFNSNGGSGVPAQQVQHGQTATRPAAPTRSDYTFGDWYTNANLTTVFNFSAPVTENVTLYARWVTTRTLWLYMGNTEILPDPLYNNFRNLGDIFNWIADNALNNRTYRIVLGRDIQEFRRTIDSNAVNNRTGVRIILEGRGGERVISHTGIGRTFELREGTFILGENITLQGSGITVRRPSRLEMQAGSKITGASASGVWMSGGTFIMHGGIIKNNHNITAGHVGGVYVGNSGTGINDRGRFEMRGGVIRNNTGSQAGGVFVNRGANSSNRPIFIKNGGIITDNTSATGRGHSVYVSDGSRFLNGTVLANQHIDTRIAGAGWTWVE